MSDLNKINLTGFSERGAYILKQYKKIILLKIVLIISVPLFFVLGIASGLSL